MYICMYIYKQSVQYQEITFYSILETIKHCLEYNLTAIYKERKQWWHMVG